MFDPVISIGAVLGVLLSVFLAHRLTIAREKRKDMQAAISEFNDQFVKIITDLTEREANPTLLITESFPSHKEAAVKLLGKLPKRKAQKFSKAWVEYQVLYNEKASLGILGMLASEITDPERALDPEHIYEVNELRRKEAINIITGVMRAAKL